MASLTKILFFIILFLFFPILNAQDIHIIKIVDANLFMTEDNSLIKMVNLNAPSINDADSARKELAKNIMEYGRINLLKHGCRFMPSPKRKCSDDNVVAGHLYKKYPLSEINMNAEYLKKGYAIYIPCDTLFLSQYSESSEKSIEKRMGVWKPITHDEKPDYFNRMRLTNWLLQMEYDIEFYFPIFGLNYRWSDLFSMYNNESFSTNLSLETGTLIYFMLPYANLGPEFRYKRIYLRGNYNALLPILGFSGNDEIETFDYWAYDIGLMI